MSGADGDESREDKNERLLNDKFVDLFEEYIIDCARFPQEDLSEPDFGHFSG